MRVGRRGKKSGDVDMLHPLAEKSTGVGIATTSMNRLQTTAKPKAGRVGTNRSAVSRRVPMRGAGLTRVASSQQSQETGTIARAGSRQRSRNQT